MKRCPSCNRTYTDNQMMNCAHDGAPLMAAAYSPPGAPPMPPPQGYPPQQGYPPPPPPGYAQPGAQWQNYPPPGQPQGYPPPAGYPQPPQGWYPGMGASQYAPCPSCTQPDPEQVKFTWWGGVLGPKMFKHVKCRRCGTAYNGKTGQSNTTNIVIYSIVVFVIFLGIGLLIFLM